MADLNGFNANDVEPTGNFEAIPAGKYLAAITDSETKPTKTGAGSYLQLSFTVLEGEYKNRVLWARLNLANPNQTAVQIARGELSAICRAVGVMTPRDSAELHVTVHGFSLCDRNNLIAPGVMSCYTMGNG